MATLSMDWFYKREYVWMLHTNKHTFLRGICLTCNLDVGAQFNSGELNLGNNCLLAIRARQFCQGQC